jgi:hypothetical protein
MSRQQANAARQAAPLFRSFCLLAFTCAVAARGVAEQPQPAGDVTEKAALAPAAASATGVSEIDLSHWNLTLPTGESGRPTVVDTKSLVAGYSSEYFYRNPQGLNFFTPATGVSTPNSKHPRTELRETHFDGTLYNWHIADGNASLTATLAVDKLPSSGKVVVGQIHANDPKQPQPLVKLQCHDDRIEALVRSTPSSSSSKSYTLATKVPLAASFKYQIDLLSNGALKISIDGALKFDQVVDSAWKEQGLYFKAGDYPQGKPGSATDAALVTFQALAVTHN